MYQPKPKYRKQLNPSQIQVLMLLFRFRFGSGELLAQATGKQRSTDIYRRLRILADQGLIAKRYEPSYKLRGKPAAYYLLPAGARAVQPHCKWPVSVKAIYRDNIRKEQFIDHCLAVFAVYLRLRVLYDDKINFFTKSQLSSFDYFPKPPPDAFIRLDTRSGKKEFFLDVHHEDQPFFTAIRRVQQYIKYSEEGDWDTAETALPTVLVVCDSYSLQKRLRKRIVRLVDDAWDDELAFAMTNTSALMSGKKAVWHLADDPDEMLSLSSVS